MFLPKPVFKGQLPDPNTSGYGYNPARSLPFPSPQNMPQGCWFSGKVTLTWGAPPAAPGSSPYFRGATWNSPIFDLRPNLRGLNPQGTTQISPGSGGNSIPIWGWSSHRLYVQVIGLQQVAGAGFFTPGQTLKLESSEFAHVSDSGQLQQVQPLTDISQQLNTNTNSAILTFAPSGESIPVRYWRLNLQFIVTDQLVAGTEPVTFTVMAGYY